MTKLSELKSIGDLMVGGLGLKVVYQFNLFKFISLYTIAGICTNSIKLFASVMHSSMSCQVKGGWLNMFTLRIVKEI